MQQLDEIIGGSTADAPAKFKRMSVTIDAADETQKSCQRAPTPTLLVGSHSTTSSRDTRTTCFNNRRLRGSAMVPARDCFDPVSSSGRISSRISSNNNDGTERFSARPVDGLQANARAVADLFGSAYGDSDDNDNNDNNDDNDNNDNDDKNDINDNNNDNNDNDNDDDDVCHPSEKGMDENTRDDTINDKRSGLGSSIRQFSMRRLRPTKELLRRRLRKFDSMFFRDNPIIRVPRFNPEELDLGDHLGSGNYGDVYEIESFAMKPKRLSNLTIFLEKNQSDSYFFSEEDDEESQPEDGDDYRPLNASLTLPIPNDLLAGGGNLDHYLRRRYASVQEQENDGITSAILGENINHSNKNNCHDNSEHNECRDQQFIDDNNNSNHERGDSNGVMPSPKPHRRTALNLKDTKAQMVKRQMSSKNLERYALKVVRDDIASERKKRVATADMITEARILAALSHPSIIRLRGIMGYAERPGKYGIIIDKLESTLHKEISKWVEVASNQKIDLNCPQSGSFFESLPPWMLIRQESKLKRRKYIQRARFFLERLKAASGVAQAMKYLHEKKIVFRDLKPENVGVTKGTYVLFDFGLSRYLTDSDRVVGNSDDQYYSTGLTGSRLFMAPEVARSKPYGFSADVFSFAILFWEVMSLQEVFPSMNVSKHFRSVIIKGRRPASIANILTSELNDMMKDSWADNPLKRPSFDSICQTLTQNVREVEMNIRQKSSSLPNLQSMFGSSAEGFKSSTLDDSGAIDNNYDGGDEKCRNSNLLSPRSLFRKKKGR